MGIFLEAAAVGLPLVLTEGCHFPEVTAQKAGLVVAPNPAKIAKAIRDLLQDTKKRTLFGTNAAAFVEKKYSMEAIGNRLLDIYAQVI